MYVGYDEEQQALRQELRDYYAQLLTPEVQESLVGSNGVGPAMRKVVKQMGTDGWLGIGWPEEYGGKGKTQLDQFIFFDESMRTGAPVPMLTINTVGPTIFRYGTDEQKARFLPQILKGEIHFCIGYTEPGAGTDLAALKTRAVLDGDEYVINGQKMFTSLASDADYCWLAVRTNPDVSKHKGISMIIVPMDTPGITVQPMDLMSEHDINQVFYEDVRVPAANLVGGENNGWSLITNQLNHERVTLCSSGMLEQTYEETLRFAQDTKLADGRRVIDQEWAQLNLARVRAGLEFLRLVNWKVAWGATEGHPLDIGAASTIKVFGTEFYLEAFRLLMEVVGPASYLRTGSPEALLHSRLERNYRSLIILTFGGGVNEVQRDLIAMFALGLPRADR
ncbi:MAG: acyl-CoA dehydrogenase family protein [Burkholderiaceae bacterium]